MTATRGRYLEQSTWLSPTNIDNTGATNVSDAISDWLASSGRDGDRFQLRNGFYWIPQGIRIGRPLRLDLNGSWLFTGVTLGPEDPNLAANTLIYPALWDDWSDSDLVNWPESRTIIRVVADDVSIYSSAVGARIQGAARRVDYRASNPNIPEGCTFDANFENQHAIRFGYKPGGSFLDRSRFDLDLTNVSVEFPCGDGVYLMGATHDVTIHGTQAGPAVVDANMVAAGGDVALGATGGLPDTITVGGGGGGSYDLWNPGLTAYPGIHHTGRQGIAATFGGSNYTIRDLSIWRIGRSTIDLELGTGAVIDGCTIQRVEIGHWGLGCINNPFDGAVHDLLIEDCYCYKELHVVCGTDPTTPTRRDTWTIRRNRYRYRYNATGGQTLDLNLIDGLTIADNKGLVANASQGVDPGDCTSVTVSPVEDTQFVPSSVTAGTPVFAGVASAEGRAFTPTGPR